MLITDMPFSDGAKRIAGSVFCIFRGAAPFRTWD